MEWNGRTLWEPQERGTTQLLSALASGQKRIAFSSPTGGGKTLMMGYVIDRLLQEGKRIVLYSNRRMLLDQTTGVFAKFGIPFGVRASGKDDCADASQPLQLAMIQTEQARKKRRAAYSLAPADVAFVDEAHNQANGECAELLNSHVESGGAIVGVTATPLGIGHLYTHLVQAGLNSELRKCGAHVKCFVYGPDEPAAALKLKRTKTGEFTEGDVVKAIMSPTIFGRVHEHWARLNPERKPTILFAPGVKESVWFANEFKKRGVRAAHIDGEHIWIDGETYATSQALKDEIAAESRSGKIPVVCNRFVLREGIDWPWLAHGILATIFGGLTSYLQSVGRLVRAYPGLDHVVLQDHGGCLDEESQILTKRGWLGIDEITDADVIATMNLKTESMEWCLNEGTLRKPLDSLMYQVHCPHLDLRVTGYHQMVMRADSRGRTWKRVLAGDLSRRGSKWIIPTSAVEKVEPAPLTDSEIGFIGWYFTDGCMDSARIRISQSGDAPQEHHNHIVKCLEGCGFRYTRTQRTRPNPFADGVCVEVNYCVSSGRKSLAGWDRLTKWLDKSFPLEQFDRLDRQQFGVLLHAMNLGDGLKHKGYEQKTISLAVAKHDVASRIQSLAVRRGYRCNLAREQQRNGCVIHILHIRDANHATVGKGELAESYISMTERVWCVQTANGTIFVRRHGKVCVMGNSWWRHGSPNADRHWDLSLDDRKVAEIREAALREKKEQEPIVCPKCGAVRISGPVCVTCGYESSIKSRPVVQEDGTLTEMKGDIFKPRKTDMRTDTEKQWEKMYWRGRNSGMTFAQTRGYFFRTHGYMPPDTLPLMPKNQLDWHRKVKAVPRGELIPKPEHVASGGLFD